VVWEERSVPTSCPTHSTGEKMVVAAEGGETEACLAEEVIEEDEGDVR
jgi:hypothetical protein